MRQLVKYGIPLFVLGCFLVTFFSYCDGKFCKAAVEADKVSALIGQVQGQCCVYDAYPVSTCQKKSKPYVPGFFFPYQCVNSAARCLGAMGSEAREAVPALIEALRTGPNNYDTGDGPIPTRTNIIMALGKIGDPRAVKPLIAALHSPRPRDKFFGARRSSGKPRPGYDGTIEALGLIGPAAQEAVPHIIPFLKESDSYLFRAATEALGRIKDPRAIFPLIEALNHPTDAGLAADALGRIKDPRAIPPLIEALNHPTDAGLVADALAEFGPKADEAVPILLEKLKKSPDALNSMSFANAIGKIRGEAAVPRITYDHKKGVLMEELLAIFQDLRGEFTVGDVQGEEYSQALPTGEKLYVRPDRSRANSSLTSGQVWIEKDGKKISSQRFSTFKEMRELIKKMLKTR